MMSGNQPKRRKSARRNMETNREDDSVPLHSTSRHTNPVGLAWPAVTREEWNDYRWQLSHRITSIGDLSGLRYFPRDEAALLERVTAAYRLSITPYYLSLIRLDDPQDPIARPAIPSPGGEYGAGGGERGELVVSGGDPLTLPTPRIEFILKGLRRIPHVEIIRIGTRVQVVLPVRIDDALGGVLGKDRRSGGE